MEANAMASTLDPDAVAAGRRPKAPKGHDVKSLGPSDTSDSGSDMAGPGLTDDEALGLDRGTNEDPQAGRKNVADAGASVGDLGMDELSDKYGTGEHFTAGKEPDFQPDGDRDTDRVVGADEAGLGGGLDQAEEAQLGVTDEDLEDAATDRDQP
jgi:hypothetical protein